MWTNEPDKNIAVSVLPIPLKIDGALLAVWTKCVNRSEFFAAASTATQTYLMKMLDKCLCQAVDFIVDKTPASEKDNTRAEMNRKIDSFRQTRMSSTIEQADQAKLHLSLTTNLDRLQSGMFKKPAGWTRARFLRWKNRIRFAIMLEGMPNFSKHYVSIFDLILELGDTGLNATKAANFLLRIILFMVYLWFIVATP